MKKIKKENSGITLIALVVSIIVLLILAGISVSMLSGENSILSRAADAKTRTQNSEIDDRAKLAYTGAVAEGKGIVTEELFEAELDKAFGEDGYEISQVNDDEWIITVDGISYTISNVGEVAKYEGDLLTTTNRGNSENIGNAGTKSNINLNLANSLDIEDINLEMNLFKKFL